jgi:U3 small nucleolar RNA-associated protein 13
LESFYAGGKAVILSPPGTDFTWLATPVENEVHLTALPSGSVIGKLIGPEDDAITCMSASPDGKWLVTTSRALQMTVYNISKFHEVDRASVEKSSIIGDSDGTAKWNRLLTSHLLHKRWKSPHEAPVLVMDFDATSTLFATGSADSTIRVWDCEGGFATHLFKGHRGLVTALKFEQDKKMWRFLYSGGEDGIVRVWDLKKKSCIAALEEPHVSVIRGLATTKSPKHYLISAGRDKLMAMYDLTALDQGDVRLVATIPTMETVEAVGILPQSKSDLLVYTAGDKGIVRVWNMTSQKVVYSQEAPHQPDEVFDVIPWFKAGMLISLGNSHLIRFLSLDQAQFLSNVQLFAGYNNEIIDLRFIDETHLAMASNTAEVRIHKLATSGEATVEMLEGHSNTTLCLDVWKGDEEWILSGSKDKTARLWINSSKWECKAVCIGHTESVGCVALAKVKNQKQPAFCLTGSQDKTVKMWDLAPKSGLETKAKAKWTIQAHEKDINSVAIAPNNKLFVTGGQDRLAKLWSLPNGEHVGDFKGHKRGVWSVAFSPVDQVLATASGDKTLKLWSVVDFSCLRTFEGHLNSVLKVDFMTLGTQLVSAGSDGLVKVWSIKNSECNATLDAAEDKIWGLTVGLDGDLLATGGGDSTVRVWSDVTAEEQDAKFQEDQQRIIQEQELQNHVQRKDWKNAVHLALRLGQPFRLLKLLQTVSNKNDGSVTGDESVDKVLLGLSDPQLHQLLEWARDWNTNSRYSPFAQRIFYLFFNKMDPKRIQAMPKVKDLLDAMIAYTERHLSHVSDMKTNSKLLDYTLHAMNILLGASDQSDEVDHSSMWRHEVELQDGNGKVGGDDLGDDFGDDVSITSQVSGEMSMDVSESESAESNDFNDSEDEEEGSHAIDNSESE